MILINFLKFQLNLKFGLNPKIGQKDILSILLFGMFFYFPKNVMFFKNLTGDLLYFQIVILYSKMMHFYNLITSYIFWTYSPFLNHFSIIIFQSNNYQISNRCLFAHFPCFGIYA